MSHRAIAQDAVVLHPRGDNLQPAPISGEILDYNGLELTIRAASGQSRTIASDDVQRVEYKRCAEHSEADVLLADGDVRLALEKYRAAIETDRETRPWVRRKILAQVVWCYQALAQWESAGDVFLMLAARDPHTPDFDCIPLSWTAAHPAPAVEAKARAWLSDANSPHAGLLGASHLLPTRDRARAMEALRQLQQNGDPRVAFLAQAQLWRLQAASADAARLTLWSQSIEAAPEALCAGPYYLLGNAWIAHDPRSAALALLQLPISYPRHRRLSAAALLTAAACLQRVDQDRQAATLYRELVEQHPGTTEAEEAQRRLAQLDPQS